MPSVVQVALEHKVNVPLPAVGHVSLFNLYDSQACSRARVLSLHHSSMLHVVEYTVLVSLVSGPAVSRVASFIFVIIRDGLLCVLVLLLKLFTSTSKAVYGYSCQLCIQDRDGGPQHWWAPASMFKRYVIFLYTVPLLWDLALWLHSEPQCYIVLKREIYSFFCIVVLNCGQ